MLEYLFKSGACLAIFLLFYKLVLERESIHVFKRYYLLGALVVSFVIPKILFTEYVEIPAPVQAPVEFAQPTFVPESTVAVTDADMLNLPLIFWTIYGLGVMLFGFKFFKNLVSIIQRIRKNPKFKVNSVTNVLLKDIVPPHTFFRYIFLNRKKFEAQEIPEAVLLHEETHANQKHSIDVLFVELLQVLFWFNPLIYATKKAIKLNHEFLADHAVVSKGVETSNYQNILLEFSSNSYQPELVNSINYSSIKKRFTVMKKRTSKKSALFRNLLLLPLLGMLVFGFAETKTIYETSSKANNSSNSVESLSETNSFENLLNTKKSPKRTVELAGLILSSETLAPLKNVEIRDSKGNLLSTTDDKGYYKVKFDKLNQNGELLFEYSLHKDGYRLLSQKEHWGDLQGKIESVVYFGLQKENSNAPQFSETVTRTKDLLYESIIERFPLVKERFVFRTKIDKAIKDNQHILFEIDDSHYLVNNSGWIKITSEDDLISINDNTIVKASEVNSLIKRSDVTGMTPLANTSALYAIYTIPVDSSVKPIKEQLPRDEYIKILINKKGQLLFENQIIELKDFKSHLSKFNSHLSKNERQQKVRVKIVSDPNAPKDVIADIEQILNDYGIAMIDIVGPENLPSPQPSQDGASRKQIGEYNKLAKHYNQMDSTHMRILKKDVERLKYIYGLMSDKQRADAEPFPDFPEPPPAPKAPKSLNEKEEASLKINQIIEEQDPYDVVGNIRLSQPLPPPPSPNFSNDEEVEVRVINPETADYKALYEQHSGMYIGGKGITYAELTQRQKEGSINSIKIIRNKSGDSRVLLNDITSPPAPPASPAAPNHVGVINTDGEYDLPPPPPLPAKMGYENPPPPPEPPSPIDHIIEMAKKNAVFYYQDEKISSDKAIQILKENDQINIDSRGSRTDRPVVRLSTEPIVIEN